MPARLKSKKALTIVEALVTMILLAVVAITALSYAAYIKNFIVQSENYAQAVELTSQVLETLATYKYDDISLTPSPDPYTAGSAQLTDTVCPLRDRYGATRSYLVSGPFNNPIGSEYKTIKATVTWNDGVPRNFSLTSATVKK